MSVSKLHVTWNPTALGGSFAAYELVRDDQDGHPRLIAEIRTEATTAYDDWDARLGVAETYRLRVRHTNGSTSLQTATAAGTIPVSALTGWQFTTAEQPSLGVETHLAGPAAYQFPRDETIRELYGRDGAVVFRGLEDRFDDFTITADLFTDDDRVERDRALYDALLELARADVPYVCVRSPFGRRWFASLLVSGATSVLGGAAGTLGIRVRELTRIPAVVVA